MILVTVFKVWPAHFINTTERNGPVICDGFIVHLDEMFGVNDAKNTVMRQSCPVSNEFYISQLMNYMAV
jgi:hypothetical protein